MSVVKAGDRIAVHFRAFGPGRSLVASSEGGPALAMIAGGDEVIEGLSQGVIGMAVGGTRAVRLTPAQAFGEAEEAVERSIPRDQVPAEAQVGDVVRITMGETLALLWIVAAEPDAWRVSSRHPLCGQEIDLHIAVVDAQPC